MYLYSNQDENNLNNQKESRIYIMIPSAEIQLIKRKKIYIYIIYLWLICVESLRNQ